MSGTDRLQCTLSVTVGTGQPFKVPSGNVRAFDLQLTTYGLTGSVEFLVEDKTKSGGKADPFLSDFLKPDLMAVSLELQALQTDVRKTGANTALTVGGLVSRKSQTASAFQVIEGAPVLHRSYRVEFVDPACLLWKQHHPCELYTNKSMQNVLDAHKGDKIKLSYDWTDLTTAEPMLFVGLDPSVGPASFYDFVLWYVDTRHGLFTYAQATQSYKFLSQKSQEGTAISLFPDEIGEVRAIFPDVPRHSPWVINSWSEGASKQQVTAAQAATGIRQDFLIRTPISNDVSARVTLETNRLQLPSVRLEVSFTRFPTLTFSPGDLVSLATPAFWLAEDSDSAVTYRVRTLSVRGKAVRARSSEDFDAQNAAYELEIRTELEQKTEPTSALPTYVAPVPMLPVEGKIVSENGADTDDTYQIYQDSKTQLNNYKVQIPLWSNQQITAPFEPLLAPGHFYFPAYKKERVLVGLEFQRATILRFLDWRAGAQLPADGQGDQLLLGKSTKSNTSIQHYYDSNKPVFLMLRTNDKDTGTIQIQEGNLMIQVKEKSGS